MSRQPPNSGRSGGSGVFVPGGVDLSVSPKEIHLYYISDDQLDMLASTKRDGIIEAMWFFLGGFLAAVRSAIPAVNASYFSENGQDF